MNIKRLFLLLVAGAMLMSAESSFEQAVDRYFADRFKFLPSEATSEGFHQYDSQLEDLSAKAIAARAEMDRKYLSEFGRMQASADRDLVMSKIQSDLLSIDGIRSWENNPDVYSSGITESVFGLISRNFAPQDQRLRSVIARERQMPRVLQNARENLKNPPGIYTQIAIEQLPGIIAFFRSDVPAAFSGVHDGALLSEFHQKNNAVIGALQGYQQFLQSDLLPKSKGDFRIGAEKYRKKLLYDEMVDIPLDRLLRIGYEDLHKNQRQLLELSKRMDASKSVEEIAARMERDHPPPDRLLETFRNTLGGLIEFIHQKHIITIPSQVRPILEETPPFMRALTTASMDTPGPYEKVATEAYFNVTLPEAQWSRKETEEFMTAFNRGTIVSTAIHEAYPGHYTQLLWFQKVPSKVRKLVQANSNVEGWAHYTEQMMLDEGYGNNDPELRFGQLLDALLRDCRYIVGIEMHTGKMTYDQGIDFFMKNGYMSRAYAERETKRGTSDPTYLVYTLGKLQILKLRNDYRNKLGEKFNLEEFHNEFVSRGGIPIKIIRQEMLGNESPAL